MKTVVSNQPEEETEAKQINIAEAEDKEVKRYFLDDELDAELPFEGNVQPHELSREEQLRRSEERMDRIRNYTSHLNSAEGINELEKEPAFKRRNIDLEDVEHSSDDQASRFEVSDPNKSEDGTTLRGTNSFLHDNVD